MCHTDVAAQGDQLRADDLKYILWVVAVTTVPIIAVLRSLVLAVWLQHFYSLKTSFHSGLFDLVAALQKVSEPHASLDFVIVEVSSSFRFDLKCITVFEISSNMYDGQRVYRTVWHWWPSLGSRLPFVMCLSRLSKVVGVPRRVSVGRRHDKQYRSQISTRELAIWRLALMHLIDSVLQWSEFYFVCMVNLIPFR